MVPIVVPHFELNFLAIFENLFYVMLLALIIIYIGGIIFFFALAIEHFRRLQKRKNKIQSYKLENKFFPSVKLNVLFDKQNNLMTIENMNEYNDIAIKIDYGTITIYTIESQTKIEKERLFYKIDTEKISKFVVVRM
jgi:hypothetical protein